MGTSGVGGNDTPQISWGPVDIGLPPPTKGAQESEEVGAIRNLGEVFAKDGLTSMEKTTLSTAIYASLANPELPPADKAKLQLFLDALGQVRTTEGEISDPKVAKVKNDWMVVSAVVDLFIAVTEITALLSKMALMESKLKQSISELLIAMAKESKQLAEQAGEARAKQYEAEAAKAQVKMGLAIGQIVVTGCQIAAQQLGEAKMQSQFKKTDEWASMSTVEKMQTNLKISESVATKVQPISKMSEHMLNAIEAGVDAATNLKKAELEREATKSEAVKQLIDRLNNLISETSNMLIEDMKEMRNTISNMMQQVEQAQRTRGEQWKV